MFCKCLRNISKNDSQKIFYATWGLLAAKRLNLIRIWQKKCIVQLDWRGFLHVRALRVETWYAYVRACAYGRAYMVAFTPYRDIRDVIKYLRTSGRKSETKRVWCSPIWFDLRNRTTVLPPSPLDLLVFLFLVMSAASFCLGKRIFTRV